MTKFDTETVKMVADALGCSVPTAAARREVAEMLLSLVAERDQYAAREAHFSKVLSVCDGGQYRNDWDAAIRRVLAERDAFLAEVERLRKTLGE